MIVKNNVQLKPYNTFGISATALFFAEVKTIEELKNLLQNADFKNVKRLILGGGSNVLLTQDFDGIVVKMAIKGISLSKENATHVWLKAGAGVVWHELVMYAVENNYAGLENLSLIPGTVGAAPMQNIGAYGVEIKDVFEELEALEIATGKISVFTKEECNFGYRESVFKHEAKDKFVILNVTFKLNKEAVFHVEYGAIKETLAQMNVEALNIQAISQAVIHIRQSKLPNPAEIGNAGSFFKNPEIPKSQFEQIKIQYPTIPSYPINETTVKVPAGWLIEQTGWKGKRFGEVGVHSKQALVLVNYGKGEGKQIKTLSEEIKVSVLEKFGIQLSTEVNFI